MVRELDGVGEQFAHDLGEPGSVREHDKVFSAADGPQVESPFERPSLHRFALLQQDVTQVHGRTADLECVRLDATDVDEALDAFGELPCRLPDQLEVLTRLLRQCARASLEQPCARVDDQSERDAKLVADFREQHVLGAVSLLRCVGGFDQFARLQSHQRLQLLLVAPQRGLQITPQLLVGLAVTDVEVKANHPQRLAVQAAFDHDAAGFQPGKRAVFAQDAKLRLVERGFVTKMLVDLRPHFLRVVRVDPRDQFVVGVAERFRVLVAEHPVVHPRVGGPASDDVPFPESHAAAIEGQFDQVPGHRERDRMQLFGREERGGFAHGAVPRTRDAAPAELQSQSVPSASAHCLESVLPALRACWSDAGEPVSHSRLPARSRGPPPLDDLSG